MKTETKVIGGTKYAMTQMGALSGNAVFLRLSRAAAGFFATPSKTDQWTENRMARGIERALMALSPRDVAFVCKQFAKRTKVWIKDGGREHEFDLLPLYDEHFAGRYGAQLQFLKWGVELNHFFDDALALMPKVVVRARTGSNSPPGSTGSPGASSSVQSA